jgi:hypothetical protein
MANDAGALHGDRDYEYLCTGSFMETLRRGDIPNLRVKALCEGRNLIGMQTPSASLPRASLVT